MQKDYGLLISRQGCESLVDQKVSPKVSRLSTQINDTVKQKQWLPFEIFLSQSFVRHMRKLFEKTVKNCFVVPFHDSLILFHTLYHHLIYFHCQIQFTALQLSLEFAFMVTRLTIKNSKLLFMSFLVLI